MSEQPNALRLAKWLDAMPSSGYALPNQAAAELRRLHEINQELLEALNLMQIDCQYLHHEKNDRHLLSEPCPVEERIRAAIAKGEQA